VEQTLSMLYHEIALLRGEPTAPAGSAPARVGSWRCPPVPAERTAR
jgi:hypothetical protein